MVSVPMPYFMSGRSPNRIAGSGLESLSARPNCRTFALAKLLVTS